MPCKRKTKTDTTYDISKLESRETQHDEAASRDSADPSHAEHDLHGWSQQQGGEHSTNAAECDVSRCGVSSGQSVHGKHRREEGPSSRPSGESHRWELCDEGWQVRQGEGRGPCHVSGTNLQHGQALRAVGQVPYFREVKCGHAAAPSLHPSQGHSEEQATSVDAERGSTAKATSAESEQEHGTTSQCSQVHEGQEPPLRSRRDGGGSLVNGEHEQRRRKCGSEGDIDRSSGGMGAFREIHASATECSEGRDAPSHPAHGCQPPCKVHHGNDLCLDGEQSLKNEEQLWKDRSSCAWPEKDEDTWVMKRKDRRKLERLAIEVNCCHDFERGKHEAHETITEDYENMDVLYINLDQNQTDVGEVFSVPRVVPIAERNGMKGMQSFDIHTGWDFLQSDHRKRCRELVASRKPMALVVSPPCGPFSTLVHLSKGKEDPKERERKYVEGRVLLQFAMELCELQHQGKRIFLFEHPLRSGSWKEPEVERVMNLDGVQRVELDQCMYGMRDPQNGKLYQKSTGVLTNSKYGCRLARKCDGNHEHQRIEGQTRVGGRWINRSVCAQVYPKSFCERIVSVLKKEKHDREHEVFVHEDFQDKGERLKAHVRRCHINLGHPSKERFIHMLKSANASEEAVEYAKRMVCSTCVANKGLLSRNVAKHKRAEGFNQQVNMDTFDLPIYQQKILKMLNVVDEGSGMQLCVPLWKGATAQEVRKAYRKYWRRWAGVPVKVLTDGGTEFDKEVQEGFDRDNTFVEKTAANAPWQNGMCERHGGHWKSIFARAFQETQPRNKLEVNELIDQVNNAKNSMTRKHGYSPMQHIFGCDLRLPGIVDEGSPYIEGSAVYHEGDECLKANAMRLAARRAMIQVDDKEKVKRAVSHRNRTAESYEVGQSIGAWTRYESNLVCGKGRHESLALLTNQSCGWRMGTRC